LLVRERTLERIRGCVGGGGGGGSIVVRGDGGDPHAVERNRRRTVAAGDALPVPVHSGWSAVEKVVDQEMMVWRVIVQKRRVTIMRGARYRRLSGACSSS
jgi:hypothetical protein